MENQKVINIYACGGAAQNIMKDVINLHASLSQTEQLADMEITLVDTSRSNYNNNAQLFQDYGIEFVSIPNIDGSGQVRSANVEKILPHIGKIANDYGSRDAVLNIIIHSASGGSGSVQGPLLAKQLLSEDKNVLVIMVGDTTSRMFANNTINTIKSYESIAKQIGKPIAAHYFQNDNNPRLKQETNNVIGAILVDYRLLFSGNIHGIDSADLTNFLNYQRVTNEQPKLVLVNDIVVEPTANENQLKDKLVNMHGADVFPISMVVLSVDPNSKTQVLPCEFRIDGEVKFKETNEIGGKNLYFVLTDNYFVDVVKKLEEIVSDFDKTSRNRVIEEINVGSTSSSGLVL